MIFQEQASLREKLAILADAAKYDVACTSSGVDRRSRPGQLGNTAACGICHTFASDGRCISLLKILFTNECIHDCKYCLNRCSNDIPRATFTPEEVCTLTVEFYRRNYIEGLFLSSGIVQSADYTMEQICLTLKMLREEYHFNGYIHCKSIPGASPEWVEEAGWYADRMSVNLELPTAEGLRQLAPGKTRKTIHTPMRQIQSGVSKKESISALSRSAGETSLATWRRRDTSRGFVPSGQSTQMIIGATGESDYEIMAVTEALYQNFDLKRVFYSAFINVNQDPAMTQASLTPPLRREHRLYQADFLLRFYGFQAKELLTEKRPFFNTYLDPKCDWALGHLEQFPVEITRADYQTLLRVPGIGTKSARRILQARRTGSISFSSLKTMGVVLKRAIYFITCHGKSAYPFMKIDEDYITRNLLADEPDVMKGYGSHVTYKQLTFEDFLTKQ